VPASSADVGYFRYVPVSPLDRDWGLFVTTVGHAHTPPGAHYPPARHPRGYHFSWDAGRVLHEHQVVYITRGGGLFESQTGGQRRVRAGTAMLLFPGVWHRYAPDRSTGWDEYWVGFEGDYIRRLISKGFFPPQSPTFDLGPDPTLIEFFTQLLDLMREERLGYQQLMAGIVHQLLARIRAAAQAQSAGGTEMEAAIRRARCLLLEHIDRDPDIEQMARDLGLGYAWFRQMFKRHTGLAPHQYHLQLRIHKARHLLAETNFTVKQVSAQLGFADTHYFCRLFRKKTGYTPNAWRRYARGQ